METLEIINVYVEEDVLYSDILFWNASLVKALKELEKKSSLIKINVIGTKNKKTIDEKIRVLFLETLPAAPHTKCDILISKDPEKCYKWDLHYGKEFLYLEGNMRGIQEYNKIFCDQSTEKMATYLANRIHI